MGTIFILTTKTAAQWLVAGKIIAKIGAGMVFVSPIVEKMLKKEKKEKKRG